ncbi:MAG: sugar-binding protein [Bacteroidales bacterium]
MKSKITLIMIFTVLNTFVHAQDATMDVNYLETELTIDGSESDWPNDIPFIDLENTINKVEPPVSEDPMKYSSTPFPESDLSGYFRTAWDDDNFYIFVSVEDDVLGDADKGWQADNIEVFFNCDLGNDVPYEGPWDGSTQAANSNYEGSDGVVDAIQLRFVRDTTLDNTVGPNWVVENWGIEWVVDSKPASYTLEASIPLDSLFTNHARIGDAYIADGTPLAIQPANGLTIGFELMVTDDDDSENTHDGADRDGHLCWSNEAGVDIAGINTELFGEATFTGQTAVEDIFTGNRIKIYPTIVQSTLNLSGLQDNMTIELYNLVGKRVFTKSQTSESTSINLSGLSSGVYLLSLSDQSGKVYTRKIIKQ